MKNKSLLILMVLLSETLLSFAMGGNVRGKITQKNKIDIEKSSLIMGDPFILLYDNIYYAYGTSAADGIEVYTSTDLTEWNRRPDMALHKKDSWGERWFWAPEVYYIPKEKKFFMYYSADEHICVATSDSPTGPFIQKSKVPMIENEKCIDNSLFIDEDGKPYLFFDRFNNGINVWVAELEDDYQTIRKETMTPCIHTSQDWEKVCPSVNEGPFVMKHKGIYYMTYSANSYECPSYGIGFATATSPLGPWTKYESNPIFQNQYGLVGIGHSAMFKDKKGKLKVVFHSHFDKDKIHPRRVYIGDVFFDKSHVPIMKIRGKIISTRKKE